MSDTRPRDRDESQVSGIARHGRLKKASAVGGVFGLIGTIIAVIVVAALTVTGVAVYETASKHGKRVQALGGAKNHMLVLPDADLDLVADSAVNAGFGSAGERCMAISVVIAVEPVADELIQKITERMSGLKIGDGTRGCDMGPLITREHRDKVASYIDVATEDGAVVVVDGRGAKADGAADGFWLGPTLIDKVPLDWHAAQ